MKWQRIILGLNALAWVGFGIWGLLDPQGMLAAVHVQGDSHAWIELRAMYGGVELGIAASLLWCLRDASRTRAGLVVSLCTLGGLGGVRLLGALAWGPALDLVWGMIVVEMLATALNLVALLTYKEA